MSERTRVAKGDKATNRFHNLRVEEVSLVDAAANEEDFLVIKRRKEMSGKKEEAADVTKGGTVEPTNVEPAEVTKSEPEVTEAPEVTTPEPEAATEPTIAEQVAEGVSAGITAALATVTKSEAPADPPETEEKPVEKNSNAEVLAALEGINRRLDEQDAKIEKAVNVRATAKGASVPDSTMVAKSDEPEKPKSKWAGTAVHSVTRRSR